MEQNSVAGTGTLNKPVSPEMPKVGDTIKLIVSSWGNISRYFDEYKLNVNDRLVEVEVKSVQKVKIELEEA